ncbi:hypothetical protein PVK06_027886 [Gossypium arboreum]|uniref:Uncharacterized protein n=1 Tax=Gossypium arboreum TaxID=29729 RepID=A0ABR0P468_GOSAR|nr:hypothetical protein PVK06_027886 [Gossypium arboreum]
MAQSTNSISATNDVCDTTPSVHSESGKTCLVQSFPKHDTIKLNKGNFIQWQQHIKLILEWLSRIKHDLRSIKKGTLTIKEYIAKVQNTYTLLEASGHQISNSERVEIVLSRLLLEYDAVVTLASFSSEPLPLHRLMVVLLEFENRQQHMVVETFYHANLTESTPPSTLMMVDFSWFIGSLPGYHGRDFKGRCKICDRFGHLAQRLMANYDQYGDRGPRVQYGNGSHISSRVDYGNGGPCVSNLGINMPIARDPDQRALTGPHVHWSTKPKACVSRIAS